MNVASLRNSIRSIIEEVDNDIVDLTRAIDNLLTIFLVETWNHVQGEMIYIDQLTDQEYRILHTWAINSRPSYSSRIMCIKDMRQVFPGLSLSAANKLVP